ncbi:MAG: flagellar biosynthesis anti-sigma factor FlgM [Proteobacteria bacterium]|nr:flagellar biosynthesis anti-sigma factor FlgM [Pseudomonadota bacterium]
MSVKMSSSSEMITLEDPIETKKAAHKNVVHEEKNALEKSFVEQALPAQGVQQILKETPIVDMQKVEEFKQKLTNLELSFNPQRIAEKILSLESELLDVEQSLTKNLKKA